MRDKKKRSLPSTKDVVDSNRNLIVSSKKKRTSPSPKSRSTMKTRLSPNILKNNTSNNETSNIGITNHLSISTTTETTTKTTTETMTKSTQMSRRTFISIHLIIKLFQTGNNNASGEEKRIIDVIDEMFFLKCRIIELNLNFLSVPMVPKSVLIHGGLKQTLWTNIYIYGHEYCYRSRD